VQERHGEFPESRLLAPSADEIMQVVWRAYGVDNTALRALRRGKGKRAMEDCYLSHETAQGQEAGGDREARSI
jgi:hypothetical protein